MIQLGGQLIKKIKVKNYSSFLIYLFQKSTMGHFLKDGLINVVIFATFYYVGQSSSMREGLHASLGILLLGALWCFSLAILKFIFLYSLKISRDEGSYKVWMKIFGKLVKIQTYDLKRSKVLFNEEVGTFFYRGRKIFKIENMERKYFCLLLIE